MVIGTRRVQWRPDVRLFPAHPTSPGIEAPLIDSLSWELLRKGRDERGPTRAALI